MLTLPPRTPSKLVGAAHRLDERDGVDPDVGESRAFEQAPQFLVVREALPRGADRLADGRFDSGRRDRVREQTEEPRPLRRVPLRHGDAPRDARELRHDALGTRHVVEQECGDGGVERVVLERQLLGVAERELDPVVEPPGAREHLLRDVDADRVCAARGRGTGDVAGAGRDVEERRARANAGGVEQRLRDARRDAADDGVVCVAAAGLAPACDLELLERVAHTSSSGAHPLHPPRQFGPRPLPLLVACLDELVREQGAVPAELREPRQLERAWIVQVGGGVAEVVDQLLARRVDPPAVDEQIPGEVELARTRPAIPQSSTIVRSESRPRFAPRRSLWINVGAQRVSSRVSGPGPPRRRARRS